MSNTYHFIGISEQDECFSLMLHQMGHTVQGSDVEKVLLYATWLAQEFKFLSIWWKFGRRQTLLPGMLSVQITMWKIAYVDEHGLTYKRHHEFLVNLCETSSAWELLIPRKPQQQGCFHVLSNITDTSYLIGDGTGRALQQPNTLSLNQMRRTPLYALPSWIQHHHQYWLWPSRLFQWA